MNYVHKHTNSEYKTILSTTLSICQLGIRLSSETDWRFGHIGFKNFQLCSSHEMALGVVCALCNTLETAFGTNAAHARSITNIHNPTGTSNRV